MGVVGCHSVAIKQLATGCIIIAIQFYAAAQSVTADSPPHSVALSTPDDQQSSATVTQHQQAVAVHNVLPNDSKYKLTRGVLI